ncbi:hypothetical protein HDU83_001768 [Entophlyctis luteolus]|nr:hypothetical protein HDU82_005071 [Entophlyctis luteolus]KAJ3356189.1 hypothetical protein HDU83_001768 [Entophlyctis luteolus]KAJ3394118.1 hypothetical protein HDU84_000146 [Entophlyctis sp. JEL0112]
MPLDDAFPYTKPSTITRVIAIAVDGSKSSDFAFEWVLRNIGITHPSMKTVHADEFVLINYHSSSAVFPTGAASADDVVFPEALLYSRREHLRWQEQQQREASVALLKGYAERLKKARGSDVAVRAVVLSGDDARDEIVNAAKAIAADMLVCGTRGLGTVQKLFLGSVSDHLVHHLECPVIVVRNNE